jgi:hypothetical protein
VTATTGATAFETVLDSLATEKMVTVPTVLAKDVAALRVISNRFYVPIPRVFLIFHRFSSFPEIAILHSRY